MVDEVDKKKVTGVVRDPNYSNINRLVAGPTRDLVIENSLEILEKVTPHTQPNRSGWIQLRTYPESNRGEVGIQNCFADWRQEGAIYGKAPSLGEKFSNAVNALTGGALGSPETKWTPEPGYDGTNGKPKIACKAPEPSGMK